MFSPELIFFNNQELFVLRFFGIGIDTKPKTPITLPSPYRVRRNHEDL